MKRIVIAINNDHMSNQFALTDFHGVANTKFGEIEFFIHRNPLFKITPRAGVICNFDILINNPFPGEGSVEPDFISLLPEHRIWTNKREAKSIMRQRLNAVGPYYENFISIAAWVTNDTLLKGSTGGWGNDIRGTVVLKDEHGSRGAGQVLFNIEDHSPNAVMNAIAEQHRAINTLDDKPTDTDEVLIGNIKKKVPKVKLGYDLDVGITETIRTLSINPTYIEEFVEGVKAEYRILFAPGQHYTFARAIEDVDGYKQACGSKGGMINPVTDKKVVAIAADAVELLNKAGIEYGSADLFLTDKGWGLFEYSSQFAANGVDPMRSREIQQMVVNHVIEKFLEGSK